MDKGPLYTPCNLEHFKGYNNDLPCKNYIISRILTSLTSSIFAKTPSSSFTETSELLMSTIATMAAIPNDSNSSLSLKSMFIPCLPRVPLIFAKTPGLSTTISSTSTSLFPGRAILST
ncbi:117aa long hypothetical protein [Pyrococcus horikoshii OT3]|uniref:Uncharacterized protein n=1 Tax=Pyrococcus horikoshii (strain ATCC 700860 / DSM 12428 / JCM 9974 / NBRC 100139 / OT-3) TaxID=70601 RepID=O58963_PYRHO|nr:117aa long hypothetical protein [Pyrococcus horikoshii OT3]